MASLHHPLPSYPDTSVGESDFFRLLGGGWWGGAERQPVARQGNIYHIHDAARRGPLPECRNDPFLTAVLRTSLDRGQHAPCP